MNEEIKKNHQTVYVPQQYPNYIIKVRLLITLMILALCLISVRLFSLQIVQGETYQNLALNNRKQVIRTPSYRGEIYLSDGDTPIVRNVSSYSIYVIPKSFPSPYTEKTEREKLFAQIEDRLKIDEKSVIKALRKGRVNPYRPYPIASDVPIETIHYLAEHLNDYPGLIYLNTTKRQYEEGLMYSHITGYIRSISAKELTQKRDLGYSSISLVGKLGIEAFYDLELRGKEGYKVQIIDAKNRIKEEIFPEDGRAEPGQDITLTVDPNIQKIIYETMQGYPGGAVVTRVKTGEILGLHSFPSYDPNVFVNQLRKEDFQKYIDNEDNPFFNRVIQGEYPPSSIFKIILSLASMDNQTIDIQRYTKDCYGGIYVGPKFFRCEGVHLTQNLSQSIANSCNVFFYNLGFDLGPQTVSEYAKAYFNFGIPTGVDLPYEKGGRIPDQKWKIENIGSFWWDGDTANLSIGQGYTLATILQINTMTAAIANWGVAYEPHLLKSRKDLITGQVFTETPEESIRLPFSRSEIQTIRKAMRYVVEWGTARRTDRREFLFAGKTGTAQTYRGVEPHSWFTGFAPYGGEITDETLAVTVFLENAGHGGEMAAPFAAAILQGIYLGRNPTTAFKEILQPWVSKDAKYRRWLKVRGESRLPDDYFTSPSL